jgi:hypothetical protein
MTRFTRWVLNGLAVGSVVVCVLRAYPGVLVDLAFFAVLLSPLWFPVLVIAGVVALVLRVRRDKTARSQARAAIVAGADGTKGDATTKVRRRWPVVAPAVVIVCAAVFVANVPLRVAFRVSRPWFEPYVAKAPVLASNGRPLGRYLGVYYVDTYAADARGGVYFRTHAGADGLGPDVMSYGFAYKPNRDGSPFGAAHYRRYRIVGDWYGFIASDDSF